MPEAIFDLDVEPGRAEDSMDQILQPAAGNVIKLVGSDDLDVRHEEGWIEAGVGDPARDVSSGYADLMQDGPISRDDGWADLLRST